jgi:hypothetical protein
MSVTLREALSGLLDLPGFRYACVADPESGRVIRESGSAPVVPETVLRWAREALDTFRGDPDDGLEDLILSSHAAYHLVRPIGPRSLLLYLCVDRARSNLALSRRELATVRLAAPEPHQEPSAPTERSAQVSASWAGPAPGVPPAQGAPRAVPVPRPVAAAPSVAAMPLAPAGAQALPASEVAAALPVPLPRRTPGTLPPPAVPEARSAPSPNGRRWADDVATIKRLLGALRAMS